MALKPHRVLLALVPFFWLKMRSARLHLAQNEVHQATFAKIRQNVTFWLKPSKCHFWLKSIIHSAGTKRDLTLEGDIPPSRVTSPRGCPDSFGPGPNKQWNLVKMSQNRVKQWNLVKNVTKSSKIRIYLVQGQTSVGG